MWYQFNHYKSLDQGAVAPLSKVKEMAELAKTRMVLGWSHTDDYVEAPANLQERQVLEDVMREQHLAFYKVEELPSHLTGYVHRYARSKH